MKNLSATLIIIGDEILTGLIYDTNTKTITSWLRSLNIKVNEVLFISDDSIKIIEAFTRAWKSSDLILTTGGLGPTRDDKTKAALARFLNTNLAHNENAKDLVIKHYERRSRTWNETTNSYNLIPIGVTALENPIGLAPALRYSKDSKLILCAPGVPRELETMIEQIFPKYLKDDLLYQKQSQGIVHIRTRSIYEEKIFFDLMPNLWETLEQWGKVSSLPQKMGVNINISVKDSLNFEKAQKEIIKFIESSKLSPYVWHWGSQPIEEVVIQRALAKNLTIAIAESCTGGLLGHRLTSISGSSNVFMGSAVTYSNEAKMKILDVSSKTLQKYGAVSTEVAKEMAIGSLKKFNADIAISLTGIAGPNGGTTDKPVGTVCIGQATKTKHFSESYNYFGARDQLKLRFSEKAFHLLLDLIETF